MKLAFWKHKDEFDSALEGDDKMPDFPPLDKESPMNEPKQQIGHEIEDSKFQDPFAPSQPAAQPAPIQSPVAPTNHHDFELLSAKLDTIKAQLDSMNQRLLKIESIAEREAKRQW